MVGGQTLRGMGVLPLSDRKNKTRQEQASQELALQDIYQDKHEVLFVDEQKAQVVRPSRHNPGKERLVVGGATTSPATAAHEALSLWG